MLDAVVSFSSRFLKGKEYERVYGTLRRRLTLFLFPATFLAALYACLPHLGMLSPSWREVVPYAAYLALFLGLFLSFHFNRSRAFFVTLLLLAFCWNSTLLSRGGEGAASFQRLDDILVFLLPVNIALFCLMREKGLFTSAGRKRFLFLCIQAIVLAILAKNAHAETLEAATSWAFGAIGNARDLPRSALPVIGACGIIAACTSLVRNSIIDSAFLGVLAALAIIFTHAPVGDVQPVFLFGAGVILSLSILQDSHNMAYRDDLTGLLSRRALNEALTGLGRRYAIAMVDLDHFKRVNDAYGHDVGDQVLRMAGAKMRMVKGGGRVYRYGGEEFAIIFPGKGVEHVLDHLEELRNAIAAYRFAIRGPDRPVPSRQGKKLRADGRAVRHLSVTVSIGVAESSDGVKSSREVLVAADAELYRAKQRGRNRISSP